MADEDLQLDEFGDFVIGADGDAAVISGDDTLQQDIRHRLITTKGSHPEDPDYGGDLPLWVHEESDRHRRQAMRVDLQLELAKEARILPQRTGVTITPIDRQTGNVKVSYVRKADLIEGQVEVEVSG